MSTYSFSESELRSYFINSIVSRDDLNVFTEVPVFCRSVDLVIQEQNTSLLTAIEFKLHDWKRAIAQAKDVGLCFDYLCICLPKPKTPATVDNILNLCNQSGIGLILFDITTHTFTMHVEPKRTSDIWERERRRIVDFLEAKQHEGSAIKNS